MSEFVENPINEEVLSGEAKMVDVTSLTEQERDQLASGIKQSAGTVQVWVHSHFGRQDWDDDQSDIEKLGQYAVDRGKLIDKSGISKMPIISFIASTPDFDPDKKEIKEHAKFYGKITDKPIYYVRTLETSPTPVLDKTPRTDPHQLLHPEKDKENWDIVTNLFKNLGVSQAVVSGMYYHDDLFGHLDDEETLPPASYRIHNGCVNATIAQLKERGINTHLSKVTHPDVKGMLGFR